MTNSSNTVCSIIVPVFNQEELVKRTLDSIPKRDDIEVIVVNDCSTDSTLDVLKNYQVKIINNEVNLGCESSVNIGIDNAKGEYILQLDSDDYLNTEVFNEIVDNYLKYDLVYFNLQVNDGSIWHLNENNRANLPDHTSFIKKSFLGSERLSYGIGGGWDMFQKLLKKEHTYYFTDKVMYYFNYPRVGSVFYNATHK